MLLAVDTSTQMVGIALYNEDRVIGELYWHSRNYHTVELAPAIQYLFAHCDITPQSLHALGVALGPGSFTGLRIGLALVKGMARGLNLPVIGIPTLDVVAAAQPVSDSKLAAVLQAGRKRLAVGWYHVERGAWTRQGDYEVLSVEELTEKITTPTLVCGELNAVERRSLVRQNRSVQLVTTARAQRTPAMLAELAWARWQRDNVDNASTLTPIYLHTGDEIPG